MGGFWSQVEDNIIICASCKGIINIPHLKNGTTPFVRPHCDNYAKSFNQVKKKPAVCRNCGDIKLVPKGTNLENGFHCSECAAIKRALIQRQIASGIYGSGNIHFAIEN